MKKKATDKNTGELLFEIINNLKPQLEKMSDSESQLKPTENRWSKKEIIGHLIDSAAINLQRFVRINFQDDLIFPGYEQDDWVRVQKYNSIKWDDLVNLWFYLNVHISRVIDSTPAHLLNKKHKKHNLNEIAWKTVPINQMTTLDYLMKDYIEHLQHHAEILTT